MTGPDFASGFNAADLTLTGEGGKTYTLTAGTTAGTVSTNGAGVSTVTFTLDAADQIQVALLLDQNGTAAQDGTGYGLTAAAGWDTGAAAVTTPVAVTASGVFNPPTITTLIGQPVNGGTVELEGTADTPGDTIDLYADGTNTIVGTGMVTATVGGGGTFDFSTTTKFADGAYSFTATETTGNRTSAPSAAFAVDVDPNAPSNLAVVGQPVNGQDVTVTGTGETVNDTITLYNGTTELGTTTVVVGGTFSFTTTSPLADSVYSFVATETDSSNLTSAKSPLTVDVDPNAPSNLAVVGQPVNGQDVTVTGTGETVNDTITLYNGTTELGTTTVVVGGTFSFTTTSPLADSVYSFVATETDLSNLTSAKSPLTVDVDPNAPSNLAVVGQPVNGQDVTVTGTGETVNDTITLYNGTTELGTTTVVVGGTFSFTTTSPLADGVYGFTATETDSSSLTSAQSAGLTVDVDPNAPSNLAVVGQPVNGQDVTVTGTGETINDTITLYNGTTELGTTTVVADGTFSFTTTSPLADGVYGFTATETDLSSLTSAQSAGLTVDVDPNAPSNLAVVGQPVNGQDVTVTGTGETINDTITLYNGTTELGTTTVVADGTFSFTTTSPLADDVYGFTATENGFIEPDQRAIGGADGRCRSERAEQSGGGGSAGERSGRDGDRDRGDDQRHDHALQRHD